MSQWTLTLFCSGTEQPRPKPIKRLEQTNLSDMLSSFYPYGNPSDILYYETLDIPLQEYENKTSLKARLFLSPFFLHSWLYLYSAGVAETRRRTDWQSSLARTKRCFALRSREWIVEELVFACTNKKGESCEMKPSIVNFCFPRFECSVLLTVR